jgi:hypothetical protein
VVFDDLLVAVGGRLVVQGRGRNVDRQIQAQAVVLPAAFPRAGLFEDRVGEVGGQAVGFEQADEVMRADHLPVAALPARERFDADDLAVGEFGLRLEPRDDFALVEAAPQLGQVDEDRFVDRVGLQALFITREHGFEFLDAQRLLDAPEHVKAIGARHHLHGVEQRRIQRTDQRHAARQPPLRNVADELDAVHAGHVQVDEHDVGRHAAVFEQRQRRHAVGRFLHLPDAQFSQQPQRQPALEPVVFHHHDPQRGQAHRDVPRKVQRILRAPPYRTRRGGRGGRRNRRCYNPASFSPVLPR